MTALVRSGTRGLGDIGRRREGNNLGKVRYISNSLLFQQNSRTHCALYSPFEQLALWNHNLGAPKWM